MNTLIVYDSQFGHARAVRVDQAYLEELQGMDILILGCPTQAMRQTPDMQAFIVHIPRELLNGLSVACFDTRFRGGFWMLSAAPAMAKQLRMMGVELVVPPESFFVKAMKKEGPLLAGEIERAATWATKLIGKVVEHAVAVK